MAKEITISAKGKSLGRLAAMIAQLLRGKGTADFVPHAPSIPRVVVTNIDALSISEKKLHTKVHWRYSGYPSGRHEVLWRDVAQKDKGLLLRRAVLGMLPKNRLRPRMLKSLTIEHGNRR